MNILFTTYQGDVAGSTQSIFYLATALSRKGHKVFMACRPESLLSRMLKETSVRQIPMRFKGKFDFKAAKRISEIVSEEKIDIINSQSGRDRYAIIWSRIFYKNGCVHINTRRQRPRSDGGYLVNKFISKNTNNIVAVSHSIKKDLIAIGYPNDHIEVIHNGTPREKYGRPNPDNIKKLRQELGISDESVPVIGSISRPKKHEQLLSALNLLDRKVKLILVGIDENEEYLKIVSSYKIPHEVHFIGTVSNETALDYLQFFDLNVLPSTIEGISQSLLEAMASGIPVIATNASGNPELIQDQINGLLFEDGNIHELAGKIDMILNNSEYRELFIKAGKETALKHFSIENTTEKYERLFQRLLNA